MLAFLVLLYVVNYVDRQILSVLLVPIKQELGASDTQMGLLSGLAFALFYTLAAIPIARLADGGVRRDVIVVGVAVWSVMTALCGFARSFGTLALARVGVGVGEATLNPAAHSLLSDYFPPERRATARAEHRPGVHAHPEERERRRATLGREVVGEERMGGGIQRRLADADPDARERQRPEALREAAERRHHAPHRLSLIHI